MNRKILRRTLLAGLIASLVLPTVFADSWYVNSGFYVDSLTGAPGDDVALAVTYDNDGSSVLTYGIKVDATGFNDKGSEIGVHANASKTGGPDPQRGTVLGRLASAGGYHSSGSFQGVYGASTPTALDNFDATMTSTALGGAFYANPSTLTLDNSGTYWVGGTLGQVSGTINGGPGLGAVAGVIGISTATGTAKSYAGYFKGDVKTTGEAEASSIALVATTLGTCGAAERGTMRFVQGASNDVLYMCMNVNGGLAWKIIG